MRRDLIPLLMTSDDRLDDVTRARIWARLTPRLVPATRGARRATPAIGMAVAFVAAAIFAVVVLARGQAREISLVAPAKGVLVAPLGPHAEATLVGPAHLVVDTIGEVTSVRLVDGMLYTEFHGGPGRALRIEVPGATVEVVGTLFVVDVRGEVACVAVAHGRVRVTADGTVAYVEGDQRRCVRGGSIGPIEPVDAATHEALARHAASWTAMVAGSGSGPLAPATPQIATPAAPIEASIETLPAPAASTSAPAPTVAKRPASPHPTTEVAAPPDAELGSAAASDADAEALYATADAALARGDRDAADRALGKLVAEIPRSPLVDEALYERARIAFDRRAWADARRLLDTLAARLPSSLSEPGGYLRCRVSVAAEMPDGAACLTAYRSAFPHGPHDLDVLGMLVAVAYRAGGCDAIRIPLADLTRAHPRTAEINVWQTRCGARP